MRSIALAIGLSLAVTGSAGLAKRGAEVPEAKPAGEAVSCLQLTQIRESRVRSDSVIDFRTTGGKWYRNTLPNSCPSLGFEERFSYKTSTNQLCSVDIVRVLHSYGGQLQEGAGCGLGKFQPVEIVKR
jgi:hypothetical protein